MNSARVLAAILTCMAISASGTLHAQARGPETRAATGSQPQVDTQPLATDEVVRTRKIAEMQAWLGRLVGMFRVEAGFITRDRRTLRDTTVRLTGKSRCTGIGKSPGVRCLLQVGRPPDVPPDAESHMAWPNLVYQQPILHFGINPETLQIQVVIADIDWVAAQTGTLAADRVDFTLDNWKVCQHLTNGCWVFDEITAKPAGQVLMKIFSDVRSAAKTAGGHTHGIELRLQRDPR